MRKIKAVMITLKARASLRVSAQLWRGVEGRNLKESGNTDGKPIEVKPLAVSGR